MSIKVAKADLDELQHVNNITYLKWVQQVAEDHWKSEATVQDQRQSIWVVLSHYIEYKNPAYLDDQVLVKTWVGETKGPRSIRHVEIRRGDNLLAITKTEWCLLDKQTGKPRRITSELDNFFSAKEI